MCDRFAGDILGPRTANCQTSNTMSTSNRSMAFTKRTYSCYCCGPDIEKHSHPKMDHLNIDNTEGDMQVVCFEILSQTKPNLTFSLLDSDKQPFRANLWKFLHQKTRRNGLAHLFPTLCPFQVERFHNSNRQYIMVKSENNNYGEKR